jgi:RNA polymerase sigma-70 factor, ECF subfamily
MCEDEPILTAKLADLDDRAWEQFCRAYSAPLLSFVRLRFNCPLGTAEEIVQMTFVRCVKSIKTFDPARGQLFNWLTAIARNEAHTCLRKASPESQVELNQQDQDWVERIDQEALPDERLCHQEVRSFILDTIMQLSSHYRQVLVMKYLENRRVADIALALGQSEKAVESLLTRSRLAFKELLTRRSGKLAVAPGDLRL